MINILDLAKSYGLVPAVNGVTFSVHPGEILGFLGPNGAGKSTTVKMLTCLIRPSKGTATVAGFDILKDPLEVKRRIGYVPESGALFETLTAWEFLQFVGELYHLEASLAHPRIEEFLTLFGLWDERNQRLQGFSKGMKQKVLICSAFLHDPDAVILDEPLNGLDANAGYVFKEVIKRLAAQGKAILFCSHILDVVEKICSRIVIINHGQLIAEGTPASISSAAGVKSLEEAFCSLTGVKDVQESADEFLQAMGR
jgi:ABC-2 type transport system ATP-binding protein